MVGIILRNILWVRRCLWWWKQNCIYS